MIQTVQAYLDMMNSRLYKSRIEIDISNGTDVLHLVDKDIIRESFSANWRGANNNCFSLGTCYASELSFTALQGLETQIEGNTLTITPTLFYNVLDGVEQEIPIGVFFCDEPEMFVKTTSYKGYDAMLKFDVKIESRFTGTPYNLLTFICNKCGVEFGQNSGQIASMPNSSYTYVIDPTRINTYRDALSFLAKLLGGFCQINRYGKLEIRHHHTSPDGEIIRKRRVSTAFGGYKSCFCGVKCRFLANQNYAPYSYITENEGLIVDLGDIPIVENTESVKNAMLKNLYDHVLAYIEYYPCSIEMPGDPSLEPGDMITTKDRNGYDKNIILTSVTFNWRQTSQIVSEGSNPKQEAVTTAEKIAAKNTEKATSDNVVVTTTFVNANNISLNDSTRTEVTSLRFTTAKDLTAIFGAEIPVYSDGEGYVNIAYVDGGIEGDVVRAQVHEGYNLITLVNHLYYDANRIVFLQLKAKTEPLTEGGSSPSVSISQDTIRSYIFAQGIITEAPWDGIITVVDTIAYVDATLAVYGLTDGVTVTTWDPYDDAFQDTISAVVTELNVYGQSDIVNVSLEYGEQYLRCGAGHRAGNGRMFAPLLSI